jgi:tetratricopeptide (TPR) repeat protein
MEEEKFGNLEEEIADIVHRYEEMRRKDATYFFDVSEFETIIDYYLEHNDVSFAFDAAETASTQHPGSVSLQLRKARVLIDKGRAMETLKIVKMLESIEPRNFEIFIIKGAALGMLGDMNGTRKYFDHALSIDQEDEVNILLNITSILQNLNHYKLLVSYLERLEKLEPEYSTHLYDLAFAWEKLREYDKSIEYYNRFLDKDPYSDSAWYNLGILYNKTGDQESALRCYDYAIAVNPENFFALFNKGNILSNTGDYKEALNSYLEYLDFENESSEAMTYAGECYDKMGDKKSAVKFYNEAIENDPEFSEPFFGLGMVDLSLGLVSEAIIHFRKATELDGENPEYWYYLGKSYFRSKDMKMAVRSFSTALKLDPFYDVVWCDLGHLIITGHYYSHVKSMLEKSLKVMGDVHGLRFILASSYLYSGDLEKSYFQLSHALLTSEELFSTFADLFPENLLDIRHKELISKNPKT